MKTIVNFFIFLVSSSLLAQSVNELQYAAYLNSSKTLWLKSVEAASEQYGEGSFERAMSLYGLLGNTMATRDKETFDSYKDQTIELLQKLIEQNPEWGEPKAVLSSTYGLLMAYYPMKGMTLGMKSSSLMEEAMKQQPDSPLVQKLNAESDLYTPEMWGGDPKQAVIGYKRCIELLNAKKEGFENWLYLDAMMGLSMSYKKNEDKEAAKQTLESAIGIEPQFQWAKSELKQLSR